MAAIVHYVLNCCIRGHSAPQNEPDERTPFIQPTDEFPPVRNYTIDHQKMKERLGYIVRSKEGKMVNVNQPLPFNLHNRPTYGRADHSLSTNTTPPRPTSSTSQRNPLPDSPSTSAYPNQNHVPSYAPSRDPSPSIQTSRSTSSLHPGDPSYLPPEVDPDGGVRRPILNARLVRGSGGFIAGSRVRQGRTTTRGRLGRFGEERGEGDAEGANGIEKGKQVENGGDVIEVESPSTPGDAISDRLVKLAASQGNGVQADGSSSAAPDRRAAFLASEFKIEDVGSISQSWGE